MFLSGLFNAYATSTSQPGGWVSGLIGGQKSSAGTKVNFDTAMSITAMQNCVTLIAESLAQLPIELYQRIGDGDRRAAREHPLWPVLAVAPNPWQTPFEWREFGQINTGMRGNSYSLIDRDGAGRIIGLYPVPADRMEVLRSPQSLQPMFRIAGDPDVMPMRAVHHVRWWSKNSYVGMSPIQVHRDTIGYALALNNFSTSAFANGPGLAGVLKRPPEVKAIETQAGIDNLLDGWRKKFSGSDNAKKIALLQEGMTFEPLKVNLVDLEVIAALKLSAVDIARIYKVPAHMLNLLEAATYNNVESLQIQFVVYCLLPWVRRHEQAMMRDLLLPSERQDYYIEFNLGGLLRGDQRTRYAAYAQARQWGWLSINDIRRLENLPPIKDGDSYLEPLNMRHAGAPRMDNTTTDEPTKQSAADIERGLNA